MLCLITQLFMQSNSRQKADLMIIASYESKVGHAIAFVAKNIASVIFPHDDMIESASDSALGLRAIPARHPDSQ